MKSFSKWVVLGFLVHLLTLPRAEACSTFQLEDGGRILVGKNYDWGVEDGLIIVNKRGVTKTAMPSFKSDPSTGEPAQWTSKFGSVSFNQYGRELSPGGMNEAGLVVETMALGGDGAYPEPDSRPSIYMLQWLQYQLDRFSTVGEVLQSDNSLRIRPKEGIQVHFFVADQKGNCAIIEFLDGKMVAHTGDNLPVKILTNSTYEQCIQYLRQDKIPDPDRFKSIERFINGAKRLSQFKTGSEKKPLDYSFGILKDLSWSATRGDWIAQTRWSIVYDLKNLHIYFKTYGNPEIRSIDLHRFDFSCATPVQVLDVNADLSGDVTTRFVDYSRKMNRKLSETAFNKTVYLPQMPDKVFDAIADYPETFSCQE